MKRAILSLVLVSWFLVVGCATHNASIAYSTSLDTGLFHNYQPGQCIYIEPDNCDDI